MASLQADIDALYRLPVSDFTRARDALAKRAGADAATIRKLQKPNLPAWAVNQLFWRERRTYDALVKASTRRRAAQLAALSRRPADVAAAEGGHAAARRVALERIRAILDEAGETGSPATIAAVNETLDALPVDDPPGRLTRPLKPMGFEGLADLLKGGGRGRAATVLSFRQAAASPAASAKRKRSEADARRQAEARRAEAKARAAALREARALRKKAAAAVTRAREDLARAEHAWEEAMARQESAEARAKEAAAALRRAESDAALAARTVRELDARGS